MRHIPALLRLYDRMQTRHPDSLWRGASFYPELALTFDDGPHPSDTAGVVDMLAKHGIRATFFLIGKEAEQYPALVRKIHAGGHQIGIHCYRHIPFPFQSAHNLHEQLHKTRNLLANICNIAPKHIRDVRPPYGMFTAHTKHLLTKWGYRLVLWNCIPQHFLQPLSWTISEVISSAIPGSIITLHDGHGHGSKAAQIVDMVVPQVKAQGLQFVTIEHMQNRKKP